MYFEKISSINIDYKGNKKTNWKIEQRNKFLELKLNKVKRLLNEPYNDDENANNIFRQFDCLKNLKWDLYLKTIAFSED